MVLGNTLTIQNSHSFTLTVAALNPTSVNEVGYDLTTLEGHFLGANRLIGSAQDIAGSAAQAGVTFPMNGVVENQGFSLRTTFGFAEFQITAGGTMDVYRDPTDAPLGLWMPVVASTDTLTIQNNLDLRLKITTDIPTAGNVTYRLLAAETHWLPIDRYTSAPVTLTPAETVDGTDLPMLGMALNMNFAVFIDLLSAAFYVTPDETALFFSGAAQKTDTSGEKLIDGRTFCIEILPANEPPVCDVPENFAILSADQATAPLITGTATDPDGDELTCWWYAGATLLVGPVTGNACSIDLSLLPTLSLGDHTFTLQVSDGIATCTADVVLTVENTPPCPVPSGMGVYECDPGVTITLGGTVADFDGDDVTYQWRDGTTVLFSGCVSPLAGGDPIDLPGHTLNAHDLGVGIHIFDLAVDDGITGEVVISVEVEVEDTEVPTLKPVASHRILWPPNHKMVPVTIVVNADDACDGDPVISVSVTSSEPPEFDGDGNFLPDIENISVDQTNGLIYVDLRSERSGKGDGRTYTITITVTDANGNASSTSLPIVAPHSRKQ